MTFSDPIAWESTLQIRPSSPAWRAVVRATYGTPLDAAELELFRSLAHRDPPEGGTDELLVVAGRRGGKSETIARLATFEAVHGGHARALAPGQLAIIPVISPLREQSGEIVRYVQGLAALPQLRRFVDGEPTQSGVRFTTGVEIRVMTADAVSVSGPTVVCGIRDELAKHPGDDTASPARETEASLRPALAPVMGAPRRRLLSITSAYIRDDLAYETDRDHFGRSDSPVLVVRGATAAFNPAIDRAWLARERQRVGERVFAREYLAEWQDSITTGWFGSVIDGCVDIGRVFSEPAPGHAYIASIDAAFRGDRFALAIAHREERGGKAVSVLDRSTFWHAERGSALNVAEVVADVAETIREYGALTFADQFAFDPLRELFQHHGVVLNEAPWTATSKPQRFTRVRAAMSDGQIRLCDDRDLISEFHGIQGKLLRSGGERLEARVGHDDLVHSAVMALYFASELDRVGTTSERDVDWALRMNRRAPGTPDGWRTGEQRRPGTW